MKNKKGMSKLGWILLIIALVVIVGAGIYFLLGNGNLPTNSIPQPPALPS